MTSNATNTKHMDISRHMDIENMTDFPCSDCGRMLHFDLADDLEGDETWVFARNDGTGEEDTVCCECYDKRMPKGKRK
jgi:hypothetical protein